jgi:TIGR03009 family protein
MRNDWLTLTVVLLVGGGLRAQQSASPPAGGLQTRPAQGAAVLDPAHNRLDAVLIEWEQHMKRVETLSAQCTRTTVDKVLKDTEVFEGTAQYIKPDLFTVEMKQKSKPERFEKWICTGTFLYEFLPQDKLLRVHELPRSKSGQLPQDSFLPFLKGMKADEARARYDLTLKKEDQWWIYVQITPRFPEDKADFQSARLVLSSQTFLPRELRFTQPNGNEVIWDIPKIQSGVSLKRAEFTAPKAPLGWKTQMIPLQAAGSPRDDVPPRVIRPKQ